MTLAYWDFCSCMSAVSSNSGKQINCIKIYANDTSFADALCGRGCPQRHAYPGGLSPFGGKGFEMTIGNEAEDFISLIEKTKVEAEKSGLVPSFGLEDVHSWGERLSSFLVE